MSEQPSAASEYDLGEYTPERLLAAEPVLDLPNLSVDDILGLLAECREIPLDDVERSKESNQVDWETGLLVDQSPEHAKAVIGALCASEDEMDRLDALPMTIRLFKHDFDAAIVYTQRLIADESIEVHGWVPERLGNAISSGLVDLTATAGIITCLAERLHEEGARAKRLEDEDRTLAREAARRGIDLSNASNVLIGDDISQTTVYRHDGDRGGKL